MRWFELHTSHNYVTDLSQGDAEKTVLGSGVATLCSQLLGGSKTSKTAMYRTVSGQRTSIGP